MEKSKVRSPSRVLTKGIQQRSTPVLDIDMLDCVGDCVWYIDLEGVLEFVGLGIHICTTFLMRIIG